MLGNTWLCACREEPSWMWELSSFLRPGNTSLLSACALGVSERALIQGPEGGTGKKHECKGISRLGRCRVTSPFTPRAAQ